MLYATIGRYTLSLATSPEEVSHSAHGGAVVREHLECVDQTRDYLMVGVSDAGPGPDLVVEGWYAPGPKSGFHPGVLVVPETQVVFIGAGTNVLSFSLAPIAKLVHHETEAGFWGWSRHGELVIMSAELEFAVWSTDGKMLWSHFVEPPWTYEIQGDTVIVDIMGAKLVFDVGNGDRLDDRPYWTGGA